MRPTVLAGHYRTREYRVLAAVVFALSTAWIAVADQSPASMHARVSVEIGGAVIKGDSDDDWSYATVNTLILPGDTFWVEQEGIAEMEFSGGSFLRLADNSKTQLAQIYPSPAVEGWTGSFYIHRLSRSAGNFEFRTPAATVDIDNDSLVRVDVIGEGATTVSVRFGSVGLRFEGAEGVRVGQGQRVFIDPGFLPSAPVPFDLSVEDDFDAWNRDRVRSLVVGDAPVQSIPRSQPTPTGYNDLAAYGEWVNVDSTQYWRPTSVVDYVPYRNGYWSYTPSYGNVWIGHDPFSYVTSHYGRWNYNDNYGWLWNYDNVWGPAWVASYRYGDNYFWSPLNSHGHPVSYGHAQIQFGGLSISLGASSYAYAGHSGYGYNSVHPLNFDVFNGINYGVHQYGDNLTHTISNNYLGSNGIHGWNIFSGSLVQNIQPHLGAGLLVRDYTPQRSIRGLATGAGHSGTAVARARRLERSSNVTRFAQASQRSLRGQSVRTASESAHRTARTRSAALPRNTSHQTTGAARHTARNRTTRSPETIRAAGSARGDSRSLAPVRSTRQTAASAGRTPRSTDRTVVSGRDRSTRAATPRITSPSRRTTATPRTVHSNETVRTPRSVTANRTTTPRSAATREIKLPSRSSTNRGSAIRSSRTNTPRVTNSPRITNSSRNRTPARLSGPSVRSSRVTTAPRSTTRVTSTPRVRTPSSSTSPRVVNTPRAFQKPRVTTSTRSTNAPRANTSRRVTTQPRRNSAPRVTSAPRSTPRVSAPTRRSNPAPRVSAPTRRSNPAPRVSAPTRRSNPAPRVSAPTRRSSPAPRVSAPRRSSAPRVSAPSRSSAPRASSHSRGSSSRSSASRVRSQRGH